VIYKLSRTGSPENEIADLSVLTGEWPQLFVPERIGNKANVCDVISVGRRSVFEPE